MATIDLATLAGSGLHPALTELRKVYTLSKEVDLADAATAKGSALAAADVIQVLDLPKDAVTLRGGVTIVSAMTGTATDATIDVGASGDPDGFVDGLDLDGAAVGAVSSNGVQTAVVTGTAGTTVDITIATATGTITGGKIRVWAVVADTRGISNNGVTALKS